MELNSILNFEGEMVINYGGELISNQKLNFEPSYSVLINTEGKLELPSGSLLVVKGTLQEHWLHQVPTQKKITTPRINLTYRSVK